MSDEQRSRWGPYTFPEGREPNRSDSAFLARHLGPPANILALALNLNDLLSRAWAGIYKRVPRMKPLARAALLSLMCACASQNYSAKKAHQYYRDGDYASAAEEFEREAKDAKANRVLYLLDAGMSRFRLREYREAIVHFLAAEKESEIKDYTSVSEEVGTLLSSGNVRGYKGEDFEKLLINVYLMLSYSALGEFDEARVEARKVNLLLTRMIHDGKRNYSEWPLARYFSGMLWEYDHSYDNAYIEYKKVYELDPNFPGIETQLIAMARKNGDSEGLRKWTKLFPAAPARRITRDSKEWVVVYESGRIPGKVMRGEDPSLPMIPHSSSPEAGFRLKVDGASYECRDRVMDLAKMSRNYLEDRIVRMKLAKIAGTVAKFAVAQAVSSASDNESLGLLTYIVLLAFDQADLRSWTSLPHDLYMCRFDRVPDAGPVEVEILGSQNTVLRTVTKTWQPTANPRSPAQLWVFSQ